MGAKLNEKCMVVKFHTSQWGAAVKDYSATEAVKEKFNTEDSGYFTKKLMSGITKKVSSKINKIRKFHNENTVPWDRDGGGLILNKNYFDYIGAMNQEISEFNSLVEGEIINNYNTELESERDRHGNLFDLRNYPLPDELKRKYKIAIEFEPVPSISDFRFDIQSDEVDRIKESIENNLNQKVNAGMKDVWNRLYEIVSHMNSKLKEYSEQDMNGVEEGKRKKHFKDATLENVENLAMLLPKLNITDDPKLEELSKRIIDEITNVEAKELRESKETRDEVQKKTQEILDSMAGYL